MLIRIFCTGLTFLLALTANAKQFRNAYVSFELPDRWECKLEGTEWICNSLIKVASKEAIIVLAAKEVGPSDSLDAYELYLKKPKTIAAPGGRPGTSVVKHERRRQISGHSWVDSLHLGSEIPSYYTRYLATVKDRLAVLVTFSAHQRYYAKYSNDFFKAIESLRVIATADMFKPQSVAPLMGSRESLGGGSGVISPGDMEGEDYPDEPESGTSDNQKLLGILVILAGITGYVFLRKKSKS